MDLLTSPANSTYNNASINLARLSHRFRPTIRDSLMRHNEIQFTADNTHKINHNDNVSQSLHHNSNGVEEKL